MVDIGKLNRRITFLRLNTSEDEMGQDKSELKKSAMRHRELYPLQIITVRDRL